MTEPTARRPQVRTLLLAGTATLVAAGLVLFATAPDPADKAVAATGDVPLVISALTVTAEPVQRRISEAGVLEARRGIELVSETRGRVLALGAEELDAVEAGQLLVEIDPLLARVAVERALATVARTESQLELARSNLRRRQSLAERDVASASALDDAENAARIADAGLREARAALDEARDQLAKKTLAAPFAGVLRSLSVEVGEVVQEGQQIGELLDLSAARLVIGMSDREIVAVQPGDPVELRVEALPGELFEGRILRVGAASDSGTKKFPVEVEFANPEQRLLPGMVARGSLDVGAPRDMILVPRDSALDDFGLRFVFVLEEGEGGGQVARRRRVEVREVPFRPSQLEVLDGLAAGERIATSSVRQLRDGIAVQDRPGVAARRPAKGPS